MPGQLRGLQFPCPFWPSALEKLEGYFYLAPRVDFIGHYEKQEVQATSPSRGVGGVVDVAGDRGRERGLCFTWGAREQPALCPEQSGQVQVAKRNLRLRAEDPGSGRRPQSRPVGTPGCHSAVPGLTVPSPPGLSSWAWLGCVSPTPPTLGLASDALSRRLLGGRGRATGLARGSMFRASGGRVGLRPISLETRPHWTVKGILRTEPRGVLCDESGHGHSTRMDSAGA